MDTDEELQEQVAMRARELLADRDRAMRVATKHVVEGMISEHRFEIMRLNRIINPRMPRRAR